jgi:hypothetical protein
MKNAMWISRHEMSEKQNEEIKSLGYELVESEIGKKLGCVNINSNEDLTIYAEELWETIEKGNVKAIFGVFPTPVLEWFFQIRAGINPVKVYSAWNVNRAEEGQKPSFEHKCFCLISQI